ncbi:hypothetical protein V2J09_009593 [Rumex salicifolius]
MRSSGCTIQQALTPEAASMVKQAVNLARRRGHAQVTPLHVANTMLSSTSGLLRAACLQSHSHPLQCRALELCFNVALNRLPTSTSSPMLGPHYHHHHHHQQNPTISNALVAAFKRAQAHQRRGSIETQQQPLLAVKIELEQLIISILDDPSVSRVMREAGFSSTLVREKVELAVSIEANPDQIKADASIKPVIKENTSNTKQVKDDDVASVMEGMVNSKRKRCCVVVGESLNTLEGAIRGVMERVQRGDVLDALKEVRFEALSLDSLGQLSREQIMQKFADITCLVKRYASKGLVFYLGDLKWAAEFISGGGLDQRRSYYCPIQHVIMELKRLVQECNETGRLWLVGLATFQTYTRCGSGHPSLEAIWGIHPIMIPAGSLGLSLVPESDTQSLLSSKKMENGTSWLLHEGIRDDKNRVNSESTTQSLLPSWLQKCKDDENKRSNDTDQDLVMVNGLCNRSWSFTERTLSFSLVSPSSSPTGFSYDQQTHNPTPHVDEPKYHQFANRISKASFRTYIPEPGSPKHNSTSSSDVMDVECTQKRFKDYNSDNLETFCNALEKRVPWQRNITRELVSTVLSCHSGRTRRKGQNIHILKEETWLFFLGGDSVGKEKIAKELAMVIFGSYNKYNVIALSSFSSTEDSRNKRLRDEQSSTCIDKLAEAVSRDPHRVFFVEDIDQVDYVSQVGIKRATESGKLRSSNGDEVSLGDSIIILSCEKFSSRSRACSPDLNQRLEEKGGVCSEDSNGNSHSPTISLDLNMSISDDGDHDHDQSSGDQLGLLSAVDKWIVFKLQEC